MDQARNDDEIDLILLLKTLWDGKWKIISFILILTTITYIYSSIIPNKYKSSTILQSSKQNLFFKYKHLNDILIEETYNSQLPKIDNTSFKNNTNTILQNDSTQFLQIDDQRIFGMFVNEFNDYEEVITILSKNNYVKDQLKNLSPKEKRKSLIRFAKNFTITKPKTQYDSWVLSFTWHKINEGTSIFNSALKLTLINVQKSLLKEIDNIAKSIDLENQRKANSLKIELQSIRKINKLLNARKMGFLIEQSEIAKELGIIKNQSITSGNVTNNMTISQSNVEGGSGAPRSQMHNFDNTHFLRGSKAISKEIAHIKNRSTLDNDLMTIGYIDIQQKLIHIQNDNRSNVLRDAKKSLENDNIAKWINFNLELAETQNLNKLYLYIIISIIIGFISGSIYVLINNSFRQRK